MLRTHTCPEWNGWIYYYNEEIRKLSYDEYDYEIDITVAPPFLWAITFSASLTKIG